VHVRWVGDQRPKALLPLRWLGLATEWLVHYSGNVARALDEIEGRFGPLDIVEAPETQAAGLWACGRRGRPFVTQLQNPDYLTRLYTGETGQTVDHRLREWMERRQTRRSAAIVAPSAIIAERVAEDWRLDRARITVIPHPLPPLPASEDESAYHDALAGRRYMLFFGRLQTLKGVHVIAQALPDVLREFPDLHMAFVARDLPYLDGTMKGYILRYCAGLESRLVFIEKLPHEQLMPIIRHAEVCVLPSLWEAFQLTCLESLGLGKLTIVCRRTGAAEIVEEGVSGFLVEPGSVEELRNAMCRTLAMPETERAAFSERAARRAREFDVAKICARRREFYRSLCGGRP
jgi:glycosyltransferase involved in cell wall biosynthesis